MLCDLSLTCACVYSNGSIMFPLSGGFSCLLVGWLNDKLSRGRRGLMLMSFLTVLAITLGAYSLLSSRSLPLALGESIISRPFTV